MNVNPRTIALASAVLLGAIFLALPALRNGGRKADSRIVTDRKSIPVPAQAGAGTTSSLSPNLLEALSEKDSVRRHELLERWAKSLDVTEMGKILEDIQSGKFDGPLRVEACAAVLSSWAGRDMAGAMVWFGNRTAADQLHQQARDLLAQNMASHDPSVMLLWMEKSLPESNRSEIYGPFFREWAARNPVSVAELLGNMAANASDSRWSDLAGQVAAQWASTDLEGAVNWVQSLSSGAMRASALDQLSYKWTETDPRAAAAYATQEKHPQFLKNVTAKWAETDLKAAMEWAANLPADDVGITVMTTLAAVWTDKDPVAAATYFANLPPGDLRDKATAVVVSSWASKAPEEAAAWVGQFEEGSVREQAMEQLMNSWAADGATQAARWLQNLPETPSRDKAVNAFSSALSHTDPEAAFRWAESISDQIMRNVQLQDVASTWLQQDPAAAQKEISQSNLPGYLKTKLLSTSSRRSGS